MSPPPATVLIPTRDRGDSVARTVRSVLEGGTAPAAVLVVDQSHDDATARALEALRADARVRLLRTPTRGLSIALNLGVACAATECIAVTGDDCEATPGWLDQLVRALSADTSTGLVFGSVLPGRAADEAGFTPAYTARDAVARTVRQKHLIGGTSACMALRRSLWESVGGFDELLGVGAALGSAEDADITIRALLAGFTVRETSGAAVVHRGWYPYSARRELIRRNWYGTGAAFGKALRIGGLGAAVGLARVGITWARAGSRVAEGLGTGRYRRDSLTALVHGVWTGLRLPLERERGRFRPP
jgi:GT2 family glycosyltransferase